MPTDAKIAPEIGDTHKKIQLCVCFPTDSTQQLSLIYKEKPDADLIHIVSLTTPKNDFDKALGFESLNRLYNYLSAIEGVSGFKIEKDNETIKVIVDKKSIDEVITILKTLGINNIKNLEDFNKTISILIENIKNPKDPNDLETNGGYFDENKIIYIIQDGKLQNKQYTIEEIVDVNTIKIKPADGNPIQVALSEIYFKKDNGIVESNSSFELLNVANKANKNIVLYRSDNADRESWFLGKLTDITNTTYTTYTIETFENTKVKISDRSSIRYVQTNDNGKILRSVEVQEQRKSKGGNPIPVFQKSSNTTTKKQRRQRKRTGKTRRTKPV